MTTTERLTNGEKVTCPRCGSDRPNVRFSKCAIATGPMAAVDVFHALPQPPSGSTDG
jgi:hypothetical protein